jgi:MFS family permease
MAIYVLGPIVGTDDSRFMIFATPLIGPYLYLVPVIAPIAGGFITQAIGIKYVFIVMAALCGVSALIGLPLLEETYDPVIRLKLYGPTVDLEKQGLNLVAGKTERKFEYLWEAMSRPIMLLSRSLICFMLSLYLAFISGSSCPITLARRFSKN